MKKVKNLKVHSQSSDSKLQRLLTWMKQAGITWDDGLIRFSEDCDGYSGPALGIWACCDVQAGSALCTIPKTAILSIHNTAISDILEKERLKGGLGLVISVLYELAIGPKSKWYGYLSSLPNREYVPLFWPEDQQEWLAGTELEGRPEADLQASQADWEEEVQPLAKKYPKRIPKSGWSFNNFCTAASWVASRAFRVDNYHGDAMVPLADVFNHKASVVQLSDEYAVAEDDDDDDDTDMPDEEDDEDEAETDNASDSGDEGDNDVEESDELPQGHSVKVQQGATRHQQHDDNNNKKGQDSHKALQVDSNDENGLGKLSKANPTTTAAAADAGAAAGYMWQGVDLRLEIAICSKETDDGEEVLEIIAAHDLVADQEVHNTYGEHGDAELLAKYAFCLGTNPFNEVSLSPEDVILAAAQLGMQHEFSTAHAAADDSRNKRNISGDGKEKAARRTKAHKNAVDASSGGHQKSSQAELKKGKKQTRNGNDGEDKNKKQVGKLAQAGAAGGGADFERALEEVRRKVCDELQRRCKWIQDSSSLLPMTLSVSSIVEDNDWHVGGTRRRLIDSADTSEDDSDQDDDDDDDDNVGGESKSEKSKKGRSQESSKDDESDSGNEDGGDDDATSEEEDEGPLDPLVVLPDRAVNTCTWLLITALTAGQAQFDAWLKTGKGVTAILEEAQQRGGGKTNTQQHGMVSQQAGRDDNNKEQQRSSGRVEHDVENDDDNNGTAAAVVALTHDALAARFSHRVPLPSRPITQATRFTGKQQQQQQEMPSSAHSTVRSNKRKAGVAEDNQPGNTGKVNKRRRHGTGQGTADDDGANKGKPHQQQQQGADLGVAGPPGDHHEPSPSTCVWWCSCESKNKEDSTASGQHESGPSAAATTPVCALVCPACCHCASPATELASTAPDGSASYTWTPASIAVLQNSVLMRLMRYGVAGDGMDRPACEVNPDDANGCCSSGDTTSRDKGVEKRNASQRRGLWGMVHACMQQLEKDKGALSEAVSMAGDEAVACRAAFTLRTTEQSMLLRLLMSE